MFILGFIILGILIYFIYYSQKGGFRIDSSVSKDPLDILKERFAFGEIDENEYERIKGTLNR